MMEELLKAVGLEKSQERLPNAPEPEPLREPLLYLGDAIRDLVRTLGGTVTERNNKNNPPPPLKEF